MVKNLPFNAGDTGSVPGQGTKTPHATRQLTLHIPQEELQQRLSAVRILKKYIVSLNELNFLL